MTEKAEKDKFVTYCGLYCENCIQRTNVGPEAKKLRESMKRAGYENFGHNISDFSIFWRFLSELSEKGGCAGCRSGGGNPNCQIRKCAVEKGVAACAFCEAYPCEEIKKLLADYPMLQKDNQFLKQIGLETWIFMQEKRRIQGYIYSDIIESAKKE